MTIEDFRVSFPSAAGGNVAVTARLYHPAGLPTAWLVLAHGAGAGHDSSFIVAYAQALTAAHGLATLTFNFPYIERGRRVPDPPATLESCWRAVLVAARERAGVHARIVGGGKSMGGRIASQVAADHSEAVTLDGLVFLGYPLHPPGRHGHLRTAHWPNVRTPALFVQGSRDTFATPAELREALTSFAGPTSVLIVEGGDHSFTVPRRGGPPQGEVHARVQARIAEFIRGLS